MKKPQDHSVAAAVSAILADIKKRGDEALLEYTRDSIVSRQRRRRSLNCPSAASRRRCGVCLRNERRALEQAASRVRAYHEKQLAHSWSYTEPDGTLLGQKITPLDRVGLYVPGGKASYPSSVLMNAIPAKVAGVDELIMVVPAPGGETSDLVLAAAGICGVDRVFTIGGAQAVGALAYGTQTVPQVDKIVGPGNAYVAAAKRRVFGVVGIDMVAGPPKFSSFATARQIPTGLPWICFRKLSMMSWRRRSCFLPMRFYRSGSREHRPPTGSNAAQGGHPRLARKPRRPDSGTRPGRSMRHRQPYRSGASGVIG